MRALRKTASGPGQLVLEDHPVPEIGDEEVLIDVAYCGICGSDLHIVDGTHPTDPPVTIGHEFSGTIAEIGADVSRFEVGDEVGYRHGWHPFPGVGSDGGFAEYMPAPADALWQIPEGITLPEATQFETITTPMAIVRDTAAMEPGERVVVSGPGPIGLLVVAVARMDGAESIVVLGTEADRAVRLPLAAEMGADETLVFGENALAAIDAEPPSVWFETSGAAPAIEAAVDHVEYGGRIVCSGLGEGPYDVDMSRVAYHNLDIRGKWGGNTDYLQPAVEAMQDGTIDISAMITDVIPLSEWEEGFEIARSMQAGKVLLDPSA